MFFASDNAGLVLPEVMEAITQANSGYALGYGNDALTQRCVARVREVFEAPEAAVYLVSTGTAANALALATVTQSYETVFCAPMAHIQEDECGAPEFFSGAKLSLIGRDDKFTPEALKQEIERALERGFQGVKPGSVSVSQVTEFGQIYSLEELSALSAVAHAYGLSMHLDGARFANAMVALDATAAEMSWKAGIDIVSFGGTKNGCMGVEAVVIFDPKKAEEFEARRKRGGHLVSKHRYLAAQMLAYLGDDVWTTAARTSNGTAAYLADRLREMPDVQLDYPPQANIIFCTVSNAAHQRLIKAGVVCYEIARDQEAGFVSIRLVCDWALTRALVDQFLDILAS